MQRDTYRRSMILGLALVMLALPVLAEEGKPAMELAPAQAESAPQQEEPVPAPESSPQKENPAPAPELEQEPQSEPQAEGTAPAPEPEPEERPASEPEQEAPSPAPAEEIPGQEAPSSAPAEEIPGQEAPSSAPAEEIPEQTGPPPEVEETPAPAVDEDELAPPLIEESTERIAPQVGLEWELANEDEPLRLGDAITLLADLDAEEAARLTLQWQVATKKAEELAEDEPEWANLSGANGLRYAFVVEDGMQAWRWRLRIDWGGDEPADSDEIALPEVSAEETEPEEASDTDEAEEVAATAEEVLGAQDEVELPVANITFTADVPAAEITYGATITLMAEIAHPREDMTTQWQYAPEGGEWQDISDAGKLAYAYTLSEENEGYLWRLLITVPEAEETTMATPEAISAAE